MTSQNLTFKAILISASLAALAAGTAYFNRNPDGQPPSTTLRTLVLDSRLYTTKDETLPPVALLQSTLQLKSPPRHRPDWWAADDTHLLLKELSLVTRDHKTRAWKCQYAWNAARQPDIAWQCSEFIQDAADYTTIFACRLPVQTDLRSATLKARVAIVQNLDRKTGHYSSLLREATVQTQLSADCKLINRKGNAC